MGMAQQKSWEEMMEEKAEGLVNENEETETKEEE